MSDLERKQRSEAAMLARMSDGTPFRFIDLWAPYGGTAPEYREADRLIQSERRAGRIRMVKHGVWELVPPPEASK